MKFTLHMLLVIVLGLIVLAMFALTPGNPTIPTKLLACLDALCALGLLARTRSF